MGCNGRSLSRVARFPLDVTPVTTARSLLFASEIILLIDTTMCVAYNNSDRLDVGVMIRTYNSCAKIFRLRLLRREVTKGALTTEGVKKECSSPKHLFHKLPRNSPFRSIRALIAPKPRTKSSCRPSTYITH